MDKICLIGFGNIGFRYFEANVKSWGTSRYADGIMHSPGYYKVRKRSAPTLTLVRDTYSNAPLIQRSDEDMYVTYDNAGASASMDVGYDVNAEL